MPLFPSPTRQRDNITAIFYPRTSAQEHNQRVFGFFFGFFLKAILEQSRKRGAIPRCPGAVALLAEAAFSLCDTRLSLALGVSVGRRHPGAQCHHLQPSPAPAGTNAPSPGFPKARKVGNHASDIPTERVEDEE